MDFEISKSLVADYESSSEDERTYLVNSDKESHVLPLISASEILNKNSDDASSSVFSNPYQVAESYEQSILEKHVKMSQIKEPELKNEKYCFKFNKGKCKLGDKCLYRHHNPGRISDLDKRISDEDEIGKQKSKKRSGLKDDLIPPKKYMKIYNKHE
ncbi:c3H1-type domain-containing protein [Nephila pilipes]|uniref:C3H1-type domain-containing protein n=1 Tax=Nephila pilipes TaxID=299642 RepID=A0A8X6TY62_NEPPI|nr:c3H1-type domain-containing protein [Nephila pilipes]